MSRKDRQFQIQACAGGGKSRCTRRTSRGETIHTTSTPDLDTSEGAPLSEEHFVQMR